MNRLVDIRILYFFAAILFVIVFLLFLKRQTGGEVISQFGKYKGYTKAEYDGNRRFSDYLTLPDGRRLAYDLILPIQKGTPAGKPLPVLFKYTPYLRTFTVFDADGKNIITGLFKLGWKERAMLRVRYWLYDRGNLMDPLFKTRWLKNMVKHGYAIIVVERPGTGASFGTPDMSFEPGAKEGDDILNWIAARPWCDGNIGMFGDSFQAMIQFAVAASGNPHLKAILPVSSPLDNYESVIYRGGIHNKAFNSFFSWATTFLEAVITPVDTDKNGKQLALARKERDTATLGETSAVLFKKYPFRDSILEDGTNLYESRAALYPFIDRINRSGIPVYMVSGWYDLFPEDMFYWYNNLTVPKRLVVRPLDHSRVEENGKDMDFSAEAHRWFDYWLKKIDNKIMVEPPVYYYVMGESGKQAWQTCLQWPVKQQQKMKYYFGSGKTGTTASSNDGSLFDKIPKMQDAADEHAVDYTATSGKSSRWTAVNWPHHYPDQRPNDEKALTYTTLPLESNMTVTGHPVANLWFSTDAPDLDVFVYLREVDQKGKSTYVTEGNLRASHRKPGGAPFQNMGLPFHSHYQKDLLPITAKEPFEMAFTLLPVSYQFSKGNRLRITVTFSDRDNFETPVIDPSPCVQLLRDVAHPSLVSLPVVEK
jgi:uncharacterized protein